MKDSIFQFYNLYDHSTKQFIEKFKLNTVKILQAIDISEPNFYIFQKVVGMMLMKIHPIKTFSYIKVTS